jgi:DNA-binding SARP family transcriptional activator
VALEADDVVEECYRGLMAAHHRLGSRAEALAAYRRCSTALGKLDLSPAPETEALRRAVLSR